jgi:hypothetical protein
MDHLVLPATHTDEGNHCYRVFRLDALDRVDHADVLQSKDDRDAINTVRGLVSGSSLELWDRGRFIGRFDPVEPLQESMGQHSRRKGSVRIV